MLKVDVARFFGMCVSSVQLVCFFKDNDAYQAEARAAASGRCAVGWNPSSGLRTTRLMVGPTHVLVGLIKGKR
jgi:hypothetical protein